ncbi:MAG: L,D-transpeptidase family protein [Clostridia bacterium]|nr:L,D-transpeptidase family protein [Clostridia bacterium]
MKNVISIDTNENPAILKFVEMSSDEKINEIQLEAEAIIGRNGVTREKREGDGKTPLGEFGIGIVFGMYDREKIKLGDSLEYVKINENLYWVDDSSSKYYNQLVDITKVDIDWKSAEHLIDYKVQYEFALEIKTNPENIPGKGSAIFIHCSNGSQTAGCIALPREKMIELLAKIDKYTKIRIV